MTLIGENAKGAMAPGCALGVVTLGKCEEMDEAAFEASAHRHRAIGYGKAREWLASDSLHGQVR